MQYDVNLSFIAHLLLSVSVKQLYLRTIFDAVMTRLGGFSELFSVLYVQVYVVRNFTET